METISVNIPAKYANINSLDEFVVQAIEAQLKKKSLISEAVGGYVHGPFSDNESLFEHLDKDLPEDNE